MTVSLSTYVIFAIICLIPVYFWFQLFLEKSNQTRTLAVLTFLIGTLSVIPLLLYQEFFGQSEWWIMSTVAGLKSGLSEGWGNVIHFILMCGLLSVFTFATSLVVVLIGGLIQSKSLLNSLRAILSEMTNFTLLGFFALLVFGFCYVFKISVGSALVLTMLLAGFEEYSKHLIVRFLDDDQFKSINDAIIFSAIVGLGFGFTENLAVYFPAAWASHDYFTIGVRAVLLIFAHALFSGIFGYYYGMGHFAKPILIQRMVNTPQEFFLNKLHKLLHFGSESTYREKRMIQGLLLATLLHTTFNFFMQQGLLVFALLVVFAGGVLLFYLFEVKEHNKKFGLIGTRWVPNEMEFMNAMNAVEEAKKKSAKRKG
jgi:RsiW-degrading membrane proteinase PrsW (M82 family)